MTHQPEDVASHASYAWLTGYNRIVPHLHEESDRSAAILGASFLEAAVRTRFIDFFVDDPRTRKLFDAYQPLSTFAAVIDVGFCLGLLTRDMRADLHVVRKIRNHFAHHPEHSTFDAPPVCDWCLTLTTAKGIPTQDGSLWRATGARKQYIMALVFSLTYFDRFVGASGRREVPASPLER